MDPGQLDPGQMDPWQIVDQLGLMRRRQWSVKISIVSA